MNTTMAQYSNLFVYTSMAVFAIAMIAFAFALSRTVGQSLNVSDPADRKVKVGAGARVDEASEVVGSADSLASPESDGEQLVGRKAGNIALALTWLATLLLIAGIIARGISAGRPPWGNMYEFSIMTAAFAALLFLILSTRRDVRWLGVFINGAVLLILGVAVTLLYTESAPLVPALQSYWLVIHVLAAIICSGAFTVATFVTVMYLVRDRAEQKALSLAKSDGDVQEPVYGWLASRLPPSSRLDQLAYRIIAFTFPLWTFAVIAGAIWAEAAWGRYWGWDPKETWAFITWIIYAGYLHARATVGWRGRKAAIIAVLGFVALMINYFGVNMFGSGLHSYAGL